MNSSLRRASQTVQDAVRTQLWPLPTAGVVLGVILGILVPLLDAAVDRGGPASRWAAASSSTAIRMPPGRCSARYPAH